jgi:hypothetical protein
LEPRKEKDGWKEGRMEGNLVGVSEGRREGGVLCGGYDDDDD